MLDASRAVPVTTSLLSDEGKAGVRGAASRRIRGAAQGPLRAAPDSRLAREAARQADSDRVARRRSAGARIYRRPRAGQFPSGDAARVHRLVAVLSYLGTERRLSRAFSSTRDTVRRRARSSPKRNALLDRIIEKNLITARGVYGFFPANAVGDDVELYTDANARASAGAVPLPAPAGKQGRQRALPVARRLHRAEGNRTARSHRRFRGHQRDRTERAVRPLSRPRTTTTTRSWPRPLPIAWPKRLPNACTSGCGMNGVTAVRKA